ncbi:LRR receptor-like serine/threonine-protein kinase FLS2 [Klebsormidium nitens]|uniref:LRR receptor-like serine/threonine-protein kinase FLS2 n=1 Tax=Klebsormidium nitens TaxID=105231 RepID=A0A1Y1HIG4_KLENI|nr:LRR receptor-like serine/threonine-protein kinase FLS2 [Klebsormidium nitens]|eukprot:GAQ78274.1 LRR receptor-like serine/threonine-protein kinase FLS2 [Klebsormidium nitens]
MALSLLRQGPRWLSADRALLLLLVALLNLSKPASARTLEEAYLQWESLSDSTWFDISKNNVGGSIPLRLCQRTNLTHLCLLSGPIPWELGNLVDKVGTLWLDHNELSGGIPPQLGNLVRLTSLNLAQNILSGSIPPTLGKLSHLQKLDLSGNSLDTLIPSELGNLVSLWTLDLSKNKLSGPIPPSLGRLTNLTSLDLSNNSLSGTIPPELGQLSQLTKLDLSNNRLSGALPPELGRLTKLTSLGLSKNMWSGTIPPEFGQLTQLTSLDLSNFGLFGRIPPELGKMTQLTSLDLSGNQLSGPIPPELGRLARLQRLDLSRNALSQGIPLALCNLTNLQSLSLANNNLSGAIPSSWTRPSSLASLNLSANFLSGSPGPLITARPYATLNLSHNLFWGPVSLVGGTPKAVIDSASLDLSDNRFSGPMTCGVPGACCFSALHVNDNSFSGALPKAILDCGKLGSVGLSGSVPDWLSNASSLSSVRISGRDKNADWSKLPLSCQYVQWVGEKGLEDIKFWDSCVKGAGCAVDLIGSSPKLSQETKKKVCLGRISLFLDGDQPAIVLKMHQPTTVVYANGHPNTIGSGPSYVVPYIVNTFGSYLLNTSDFLDQIYLGPRGSAYTGVGFTRVQSGNLCGNPEARTVVIIAYVTFAALLPLLTLCVWAVATWQLRRQKSQQVPLEGRKTKGAKFVAYVWSVVRTAISYYDLYTDIKVLIEIWGAWPVWLLLPSLLAPTVVLALILAKSWVVSQPLGVSTVRLAWVWPGFVPVDRLAANSGRSQREIRARILILILMVLLWPVGLLGVVLYDVLVVFENLGVCLLIDKCAILSFGSYAASRGLWDLLLRSIPQAGVQTALYLLGSSRATRIYIDGRIFAQSIGSSLLGVVVHYCMTLWDSILTSEKPWIVFWNRLNTHSFPTVVLLPQGPPKGDVISDDKLAIHVSDPSHHDRTKPNADLELVGYNGFNAGKYQPFVEPEL